MPEIVYENIIEAIRSQNPYHVLLNCLEREGFAVRYQNRMPVMMADNTIGMISPDLSTIYYRGEQQIYPSCYASLYRLKRLEERIVALLKTYDFQQFLETTDQVREWRSANLHVDLWALSQHYEFATPMIDITSEIAVAAFFATHQFDWRINQYTLVKEGIGRIICIPGIADLDNDIKTIGIQPFERPGRQDGAALWLGEEGDLYQRSFSIKFKQNEVINLKLEKAMLVGEDVFFPYEPISEIAHMIKHTPIVTSKGISRFIDEAKKWLIDAPNNEQQVLDILAKERVKVVDAPLAVGYMMGDVHPPAMDAARTIVRRPMLRKYIGEH